MISTAVIDSHLNLQNISCCTRLRSLRLRAICHETSVHALVWRKWADILLRTNPQLLLLRLDLPQLPFRSEYSSVDWSLLQGISHRFQSIGKIELGVHEELVEEIEPYIMNSLVGRARSLVEVGACLDP